MEIFAEFLVQLLGWVLQFVAELLLQICAELIVELLGHGVRETFKRRPEHPWLAAVGYLTLGVAAGAISLWLLPEHFIHSGGLRALNLVLTPVAAGFIMGGLGAWRRRRAKEVIRLESFSYGFCFAFAMALVRYAFGR